MTSEIGLIVLSYPAFCLMSLGTIPSIVLSLLIFGGLTVLLPFTIRATLSAIFPTSSRYSGFAISYRISASLFGGTALYDIRLLISLNGPHFIPAYYLMLSALFAIIPILLIEETANKPLAGSKVQCAICNAAGRRKCPEFCLAGHYWLPKKAPA